jgi:hypothetical protein
MNTSSSRSKSAPESPAKEPNIGEEMKKMQEAYEPLLPVEKKLIAWSLGIGLALLGVLSFVSKLLPGSHGPG